MKKKIAFVCIHNSCRSQMAEAWAKHLAGQRYDFYSAGTEDYPEIKPKAVEVMGDVGIDLSDQYPKVLKDIPQSLDILITMGCGVECPYVPTKHREDWDLTDPSGGTKSDFETTRDLIKYRVETLLKRLEEGDLS